jgi:hypothetical protein
VGAVGRRDTGGRDPIYAKDAGVKAGTHSTFKDRMIAAGFEYYHSKKAREYLGICLRPEVEYKVSVGGSR